MIGRRVQLCSQQWGQTVGKQGSEKRDEGEKAVHCGLIKREAVPSDAHYTCVDR